MTDLEELEIYWKKKYPNLDIRLNVTSDGSMMYFGRIATHNRDIYLSSFTLGGFIKKGEEFFRGN